MRAVPLRGGKVGAIAVLKIDQESSDIPVDSRVAIRPRSVHGLKYVELQRGRSKRIFGDGDTMRAEKARIPVDLDEFYGIFDEDTRAGARRSLRGFGDAFAVRGSSLNETIERAPPNVRSGTPQHLHSNNYSAAVDSQGNADCESGQRGYPERINHYGDKRFKTVVDPHLPGNQGTTFTGRPRVPEGQTFSRQPEAGPRIPKELDP